MSGRGDQHQHAQRGAAVSVRGALGRVVDEHGSEWRGRRPRRVVLTPDGREVRTPVAETEELTAAQAIELEAAEDAQVERGRPLYAGRHTPERIAERERRQPLRRGGRNA